MKFITECYKAIFPKISNYIFYKPEENLLNKITTIQPVIIFNFDKDNIIGIINKKTIFNNLSILEFLRIYEEKTQNLTHFYKDIDEFKRHILNEIEFYKKH